MQRKRELFTIGEFSKITGVGIHSLRYYDEIGVLRPEYVDPVSSYRYYSFDQLRRIPGINICIDSGIRLSDFDSFIENDTLNYEKLLNDSRDAIDRKISEYHLQQQELEKMRMLLSLRKAYESGETSILEFQGHDIWLMPYPDSSVSGNEADLLIKLSSHARRRGCRISPFCFGLIIFEHADDPGPFAFAAIKETEHSTADDPFISHLPSGRYLVNNSSSCSLDEAGRLKGYEASPDDGIILSFAMMGEDLHDSSHFSAVKIS